ncbi:hypothetical protein EHQ12_11685 [Leptospira gomenensis]|uniref:Uncharacterized protein n=1 Tax=Leptospira gomenensis TaxID=2484974 RepID=A0A5F1YY79_9LEPT|nr:hypothetical protein [Leptospira gomenensis]TGK34955.1 hypothetical protein EHQ17_07960 [Leptospira gomenensis]TGK36751.1 hypothetical protein EHQ12_11685 [Leptospira gomenensis]TGK48844.1 hypothetical protein EHQ07_05750 [Leptospira gomenensis]TGK64610.1 hypothetical protein EHQ13_06925 [Leptospira gomenensis]
MKFKYLFLLCLLLFFFTACPDEKKKENELSTYIENSLLIDMFTKYDCVTGNDVISDTYNGLIVEFVYKPQYSNSSSTSTVLPKAILRLVAKTGQTLRVSSITTDIQYQGVGSGLGYNFIKGGCHGSSISFIGPNSAFASSTQIYVNANSQASVEFNFSKDFDGIIFMSGLHVGDPLPGDVTLRVF